MSAIFGGDNSSFRETTPQTSSTSPDRSRSGNPKARSRGKVHPGADICDSPNSRESIDSSSAKPSIFGGIFSSVSGMFRGNNSSFKETTPFTSSPDSKGRSSKSADGSRARPGFPSAHGGSFFDVSTIHGGNNSSFRETTPFTSSPDSKGRSEGKTGQSESTHDVQSDVEEESEKESGWKEYQTPKEESAIPNVGKGRPKVAKDRWSIDSIPTLNDVDAMSPDSDPNFPKTEQSLAPVKKAISKSAKVVKKR